MTPTDPPAAPTDPTAPARNPNRAAMLIVFLVVFIDLLGFGIVLPLLPRYAELYLGGFPEWAHGVAVGVLFSVFSLMQFVFSPMWGRVSDRIGRRPVLLISLAGSVAFYALFGLASTLPGEEAALALALLFVSRVGAGIAGASVSTAAAVIADCTTPEKRSHGMALIGVAFGIGFTFGPLIGYLGFFLFDDARWAPGATAAALSLVALLLAVRVFPETYRGDPTAARKEWLSVERTREVLRMPLVGTLVLIYFLVIFAFANFEGTLAVLTKSAFGMGERDNFLVFAYVGFILMVAQGGFYRRMVKTMSEERLINYGVSLMFLGLGGLAAVAWFSGRETPADPAALKVGFYLALAVAVFGFAFVNPSVTALVSKRADPTRQGETQGVNQSFASLGRILGPLLGLTLFYLEPSRTLPYLAGVATLVLVVLLLPRIRGARPAA
jgi:DHA1 family tetracycline resistance protein-like MFS transporter